MPLIACPECGGKLSTAAESCPHCGHPCEIVTRKQTAETLQEPKCYACDRPATQKCPRCNRLSCVNHVEGRDQGKQGYELRCAECRAEEDNQQMWGFVTLVIIGIIVFLIIAHGRAK